MEAIIYNTKGKESGKIALSEKVWGLKWNGDLIHQVVTSMRSNARAGTAKAKDRSEVSGGGKKPWQQKGTGRARHGSSRSPIWRHGGVTHGPLAEENNDKKINKKVRIKALHTILSEKLRRNEILFIDTISLQEPKTREAKNIITAISGIKGFEKILTKKNNATYIATGETPAIIQKSFANFGNMHIDSIKNMNSLDLLNYKFVVIIMPKLSVPFIEGKLSS